MAYQKLTPIVATGTSAPRYLGDRFADVVCVKDYGAVGDGETDDSTAWAAWENALQSGGLGFIPAGQYVVNGETKSYPSGSIVGYATKDWVENKGYAIDSSVVHNSGAEEIDGIKTLSSELKIKDMPRIVASGMDFSSDLSDTFNKYIAFSDGDLLTYCAINATTTSSYNNLRFLVRKNKDTTTTVNSLTGVGVSIHSDDTKFFYPVTTGVNLGSTGSSRWAQVYAVNSSISTSDQRLKSYITAIPDAVLDAWGEVSFVQFKLNEAVEKKGVEARLHSGLVAQQINEAFSDRNIDVSRYGFFCHDSWDAVSEQRDENGGTIVAGSPAGDEYSLRYEEALCIEAAYQRRRADRLEARVSALEELVNQLTNNQNN